MSIATRFFLVFSVALLAGFPVLGHWLSNELKAFHNQSYEEVLVDTANLFAEIVADDIKAGDKNFTRLRRAFDSTRKRKISAQIYAAHKQAFDLRVYVTDAAGKVLFDSNATNTLGDDYSAWRDVFLTLQGNYGARTSDENMRNTDGSMQLVSVSYVAAPVISDGVIIGVVSIGKPKTNIETFVAAARQDVIRAMLLTVLFSLGLGLLLYMWISRPLAKLVRYADTVSRGEKAQPPAAGGREMQSLAHAMATMRSALEDREYVERYVQNLTHEIKSPLTSIRAAAELLEADLSADQRQQFSANIIADAQRLTILADRLLKLAGLEKLDKLQNSEHLAIDPLVSEVIATIRPLAHKKELHIEHQGHTNMTIDGDKLLLGQALENLLRNAIDFSSAGGSISVVLSSVQQQCLITVTDDGAGIPDFAMEHLFDRFYSLPRPSGKKSTGLGLNFVREVAALHGGTITLANKPSGRGTIATLHINHIITT